MKTRLFFIALLMTQMVVCLASDTVDLSSDNTNFINKFRSPKYGYEIKFPSEFKVTKSLNAETVSSSHNGIVYSTQCLNFDLTSTVKVLKRQDGISSVKLFKVDNYNIAEVKGLIKGQKGRSLGYLYMLQKIGSKTLYSISVLSKESIMPDTSVVNKFLTSFKAVDGYTVALIDGQLKSSESEESHVEIAIDSDVSGKRYIGGSIGISYPSGVISDSRLNFGMDLTLDYSYVVSSNLVVGATLGYSFWGDDGSYMAEFNSEYNIKEQTGSVKYFLVNGSYIDKSGLFFGAGVGYYGYSIETITGGGVTYENEDGGIGFAPEIGYSSPLGLDLYYTLDMQYHFAPDDLQFLTIGISLYFGL